MFKFYFNFDLSVFYVFRMILSNISRYIMKASIYGVIFFQWEGILALILNLKFETFIHECV